MSKAIGIDLGTTNSVVAIIEGGRVETLPNREGSKLTPSVVFYKSADEIIVGELAKRQFITNPQQCVRSVKRIIGKRFSEMGEEIEDLPYTVVELDDGMAGIQLKDGVRIRPEEVSADILETMRKIAEDFVGEQVTDAVVTVPAHFNDQQRTATKAAAEMAGLNVQRIINEPTAAALAYGIGNEDRAGVVAVFDFGGGTFDFTILEISGDIFEVRSTNGDNHLGGDDIDNRIFQEIRDGILQRHGIDPLTDAQATQRIREAAEKAKCELSTLNSTVISLPFIVADSQGPKHFEMELTREYFNVLMDDLFQRLFPPCQIALMDANLSPADVAEVLLVGGSTRIPRVQEMVRDFFGREPNRSINPDEAIAAGAAVQSAVITGSIREVLLIDVTPLTLGIELVGGVFKELIERNSSIPCEASRRFTTVVDNQTSVVVHALQGERKIAAENHSLAKFRLVGIPPSPKELPEIEVRFSIDANGILSVSATDMTTGAVTGVVVENYGDIGSRRDEINRLIDSASMHAEDDERFMKVAEKRAQVDRLQDRANKFVAAVGESLAPEQIKAVKETMLRLDLAIEAGNDKEAIALEGQLRDQLADFEQDVELQKAIARSHTASRSDEFGGSGRSPSHVSRIEEADEIEAIRIMKADAFGLQKATDTALPSAAQTLVVVDQAGATEYNPDASSLSGNDAEDLDLDLEEQEKAPSFDLSFDHETYDAAARDEDFDVNSVPPPPPPA
jgi:molecular chaperone DnaK